MLCPFAGGALKPVGQSFAHVCCVMWLPEVGYTDCMDRVLHLNRVNPQRLNLRCSICNTKHGACVQCSVKECCAAVHVVCAHRHALLRMQTASAEDDVAMMAYCRKHAPPLPPELSQTPEKERVRVYKLMPHVQQGGRWAQPFAKLTPEDIHQNLVALHKEQQARFTSHSPKRGSNALRHNFDGPGPHNSCLLYTSPSPRD